MTHIEQRADTAANWTAANPVLYENEVGWETGATPKHKLGDGVTPWNSLPYGTAVIPTSVALTGNPTAPTPATGDDDTSIATTEWVKNQDYASLVSPVFTGDPKAPTPAAGDDDTSIATTAFVKDQNYLTAADVAALIAAAALAQNPIGSIKITTVNTNPGTYLGGTWVAWGSGRVPVGVDTGQTEFDTPEETGGSKIANLAHTHTMTHTHPVGAHTHSLSISENATLGGAATRTNSFDTGAVNGSPNTGASSAASTGTAGSTTQSILQPYITAYMWKRTA
jgi:hypothetical protein